MEETADMAKVVKEENINDERQAHPKTDEDEPQAFLELIELMAAYVQETEFQEPREKTLPKLIETRPKQDDQTMPKAPKNKAVRRTHGTADTDTKGKNSQRYKWIRDRVKQRQVNPSINAISQQVYGGKKMGKATAEKYQQALFKEGLIEPYQLPNGRQSYRLLKNESPNWRLSCQE